MLVRRFGPEVVNQATIERGHFQAKCTLETILQGAGLTEETYFKELSSEDIDEIRQGEQVSRLIDVMEGLPVGVGR